MAQRRLLGVGMMLAGLLLWVPAVARAQEKGAPGGPGGMVQVTGTVQAVDATGKTITLLVAKVRQARATSWQEASKDVPGATVRDGKVLLTLQITEQTRLGRRSEGSSVADLKAGDTLLVSYAMENGKAMPKGVRHVPGVERPAPGATPAPPKS